MKKSGYRRLQESIASSTPGSWVIRTLIAPLDALVFKLSGGRLTAAGPVAIPHLLLTTTGRKSGKAREVQLVYSDLDGDVYVVASNFGREKHPAWSYNLDASPAATMQIRDTPERVTAVRLSEAEAEAVWPRLTANIPMYAAYETRTDRTIRVYRLSPA